MLQFHFIRSRCIPFNSIRKRRSLVVTVFTKNARRGYITKKGWLLFAPPLSYQELSKVVFPSEYHHHPSQRLSRPCRRSDTCYYLSRHSYDIWLSVVPRGLWYRLLLQRLGLLPLEACGAYRGHR